MECVWLSYQLATCNDVKKYDELWKDRMGICTGDNDNFDVNRQRRQFTRNIHIGVCVCACLL